MFPGCVWLHRSSDALASHQDHQTALPNLPPIQRHALQVDATRPTDRFTFSISKLNTPIPSLTCFWKWNVKSVYVVAATPQSASYRWSCCYFRLSCRRCSSRDTPASGSNGSSTPGRSPLDTCCTLETHTHTHTLLANARNGIKPFAKCHVGFRRSSNIKDLKEVTKKRITVDETLLENLI